MNGEPDRTLPQFSFQIGAMVSSLRSVVRRPSAVVCLLLLVLSSLLFAFSASGQSVVINEFGASNWRTYTNAIGQNPDWIEIFNTSGGPIDLSNGWYLTDERADLTKWAFPTGAVILPGEYIVISADASTNPIVAGQYHANFALSAGGEYLAITRNDGTVIEYQYNSYEYSPGLWGYPPQVQDISYGIGPSNDFRYFDPPTPGDINTQGAEDFVADTKFSHDRGFCSNAFQLVISSATPGAKVYYTLNCEDPTTESTLFTHPILIDRTTIVRARGFKAGLYPTDIDTQSYIFLDDIIVQPEVPAGYPDEWDFQSAQYGMDPDIVTNPAYAALIRPALLSLPMLSIVTPKANFFDQFDGIYQNPDERGILWERPVSMEWIDPTTGDDFHINCGARIQGNTTRNMARTRKKSFRFLFKRNYGPPRLDFPLFATRSEEAATSFDNIVVRCGSSDSYTAEAPPTAIQYLLDEYVKRRHLEIGGHSSYGRHVHLYINGMYWGMYDMLERLEANFFANYYGGDKDQWDVVESGTARDGSVITYWNALVAACDAGVADNASYQQVQGNNPDRTRNASYINRLDMENYIDYMLINHWAGCNDWGGNNWCAGALKPPNDNGHKFATWDAERSFDMSGSISIDETGNFAGVADPYSNLLLNHEFRLRFADRIHRHVMNGGPLSTNQAVPAYVSLSQEIELAMVAESARWGDMNQAYLGTQDMWKTRRDTFAYNLIPTRVPWAMTHWRSRGLYPNTGAPVFHVDGAYRHGGSITNGALLTMTNAGMNTIYFTLDGSDPRTYWTGEPAGTEYSNAIPLTAGTVVKARAYVSTSEWSALNEAVYCVDGPPAWRVTEIMHDPRPPEGTETNLAYLSEDYEFIELQNASGRTIGIGELEFTDGLSFNFTGSAVTLVGPGDHVVIVKNLAAFTNRYDDWATMNIAGTFEGSLNSQGERITLKNAVGTTIASFTYDNSRGWPVSADGAGHSLVPVYSGIQTNDVMSYGGNWRACTYRDGSPGMADPDPVTDVVINEFMAHTDYTNGPIWRDSDDWIELYNTTLSPIDLTNWYLSDNPSQLRKWEIPGTTVGATGWVFFSEVTDFHPATNSGFGLNKAGEQIYLSYLPGNTNDRVACALRFKGQENGMTEGSYADGDVYRYALSPTTNAANAEPTAHVVITEIMYYPAPTAENPDDNKADEYIELYNPGPSEVHLYDTNLNFGWRIGGGVNCEFPSNAWISAGERLVLVSFDPADTEAKSAFLEAYGLYDGQVRFAGPYDGRLNNLGERIALEKPLAPDLAGDPVCWVIVDEVIYFDRTPWPAGTYSSLERLDNIRSGNDPANWQRSFAPTPGLAPASVVLTSPEQDLFVLLPFVTNMAAEVEGAVDCVEFYVDTTRIAIDSNAPYSCVLDSVTAPGDYVLTARSIAGGVTNVSPAILLCARDVLFEDWAYKAKVTFAGYDGTTTLTNFPALVAVGTNISGFSYGQMIFPDGADLRFADATEKQSLYFEIEEWNTNGTSHAWVRLPALSNSATYVYMYWGNVAASNLPASQTDGSVWANGYELVLHMTPSSWQSDVAEDSTMLGHYPVAYGTCDWAAGGGRAGGALRLHGDMNDRLDLGSNDTINVGTDWTIGAWVKNLSMFTAVRVLAAQDSGDRHVTVNAMSSLLGTYVGTFYSCGTAFAPPAGEWHSVAAVGSGAATKFYVDGSYVGQATAKSTAPLRYIGNRSTANKFGEYLDEFRVSTVARSPDWIRAAWLNMASNSVFADYEAIVEGPIDEDDDGMADAWELQHFLATNATDGAWYEDKDRDGFINLHEYIAGTDPTNPLSYLMLDITLVSSNVVVSYDSIAATGVMYASFDRWYDLEDSTNLILTNGWTIVPGEGDQQGDGTKHQYIDVAPHSRRYFRLKSRLAP